MAYPGRFLIAVDPADWDNVEVWEVAEGRLRRSLDPDAPTPPSPYRHDLDVLRVEWGRVVYQARPRVRWWRDRIRRRRGR